MRCELASSITPSKVQGVTGVKAYPLIYRLVNEQKELMLYEKVSLTLHRNH